MTSMMEFLKGAMTRAAMVLACAVAFTAPAHAGREEKARDLVDDAAESLRSFASDRNFDGLWDLMDEAEALVVIPRSVRAGFVFGGSGGNGVMIAKNESGGWSEPVFLRISSFSLGLQAGGQVSEVVLAVMTDRGVRDLLSSTVKLGADMSIAVGPFGGGAKAATSDVLAFSRAQGVYGGISAEGGVLKVNNNWNEAYYGAEVTPRDVVRRGAVANPASGALKEAAAALAAMDAR